MKLRRASSYMDSAGRPKFQCGVPIRRSTHATRLLR
jgi:hypothetical protein